VVVLNGDNGPRRTITLGKTSVDARDNAADDHFLAIAHLTRDNGGQRGIRLCCQASSKPSSGCPETYRPSISRSSANSCLRSQDSSGISMAKDDTDSPSSPPKLANRSNWPLSAAFFVDCTESTASS